MSGLPEDLGHVCDPRVPYDLRMFKDLRVIRESTFTVQQPSTIVRALHLPLLDSAREHVLAVFELEETAHLFAMGQHRHVPDHYLLGARAVMVVDVEKRCEEGVRLKVQFQGVLGLAVKRLRTYLEI